MSYFGVLKGLIKKNKILTNMVVRVINYSNTITMSPSKQWGRIFDLNQKKLVVMDGFKMFVMGNDYIGHSILKSKSYEPHVTSVVKRLLKEGDVFLDIGANVGYFTMLASSLVKSSGKVIAFEPNPQNLQLIYSSMFESNTANVDIYPYAVSDKKAILKFTTVGSNGGVVTESAKVQQYYFLVPAVVTDEVLGNEEKINLIKIDIEAHEPYAIRGMEKLIKRLKPKIITEFHPWAMKINNLEPPEAYLKQLFDLGYQISIIETSGKLLKVARAEDILDYWCLLNLETAHLDLLAEFA